MPDTVVGGSATLTETRTSGFEYDATTGLLNKTVVEPASGDITEPGGLADCVTAETNAAALNRIQLATTYTHDSFGNRTSVTVTADHDADAATAPVSRTVTTAWGERDATTHAVITPLNGRFPITTTNALNHSEHVTFDRTFGVQTRLNGPNNLETLWAYDTFGRKLTETRADGTETRWTYEICGVGLTCPEGVEAVTEQGFDAGGNAIAAAGVAYLDILGRKTLTQSEGFGGPGIVDPTVFVDTTFDSLGRTLTESRPYYAGDTPVVSTTTYDATGRVIKTSSPFNGGSVNETVIDYDGLTTSTTVTADGTVDGAGTPDLVSVKTVNALGQTAQTLDPAGTPTTFDYDANGNLRQTRVNATHAVVMSYDRAGRKVAMDDPDMGVWSYVHNAFGELVSQTDAKGQTVTMTYDTLGRMKTRSEPKADGTAGTDDWVWTYDSTANGPGVGKLTSVARNGGAADYLYAVAYDSVGRPSSSTRTINNVAYTASTTFDSAGRVDELTYPVTGFKVKHHYAAGNGALHKVTNAGATTTYWEALAANAEGSVTEEDLGNGLTTVRDYVPETGLVQQVQTGLPAEIDVNPSVQHLAVAFDALGNLTERGEMRINGGAGRGERFLYDSLNRLTSTTIHSTATFNGTSLTLGATTGTPVTMGYDVYGNLTHKSDVSVSNYGYGAGGAGPHAVTSAGAKTYQYDANGNLTLALDGIFTHQTVSWTAFNKPHRMVGQTSTSEFNHDHNRARIQHLKTTGALTKTITYIGTLFELHDDGVNPKERVHYIKAGGTVAIFTDYDGGTTPDKTRYLHKDHLGSVVNITTESGTLVGGTCVGTTDGCLAYDAWGKRRTASDWSPATGIIAPTETTRGFTGHEHLDQLGLVHMNGRIYDSEIGRFLSADPHIQAPNNSQSYNRYTYVLNNPLSYTDPSGFFFKAIAKFFKSVLRGVGKIVKKALRNRVIATVVQIGAASLCGPTAGATCAAIASGLVTAANGGSIGDALTSAALAFVQAEAFSHIGKEGFFGATKDAITPQRVIAHGVVSGAASAAQGGDFLSGFASGAVSKSLGGQIQNFAGDNDLLGALASAAVGGATAKLGGGKFVNGAVSAAFGYLYNQVSDYPGVTIGSDGIARINGMRVRGYDLAGRVHPLGIMISKQGFPIYDPVAIETKTVPRASLTGVYKHDAAVFNKAANLKVTPPGTVWHHHQDGVTGQLIPKKYHKIPHTGGAAIRRSEIARSRIKKAIKASRMIGRK